MAEGIERSGTAPLQRYPIAALIRFTLVTLYLALALPLPLLAPSELKAWLLGAVPLGLVLVVAMLSERVLLDGAGIRVGHPAWCSWLLRRGWQLSWADITALVPITTSQGGTVHYVRSRQGSHFLLPQRVGRFPHFLEQFQLATGLETLGIGRMTPPWTYWTLALLSLLLLVGEGLAFSLAPSGRFG